MDAREYLAKKGLSGERDSERPTTLEEKAWSRARGAGDHRPRAGTPHDWEEWERHHDELAEGAETLQQKIDYEAHRELLEHEAEEARQRGESVQTFTPEEVSGKTGSRVEFPEPGPRGPILALAILMPPLAVGLSRGGSTRVGLNLLLTLLGWLPGVWHALRWVRRPRA